MLEQMTSPTYIHLSLVEFIDLFASTRCTVPSSQTALKLTVCFATPASHLFLHTRREEVTDHSFAITARFYFAVVSASPLHSYLRPPLLALRAPGFLLYHCTTIYSGVSWLSCVILISIIFGVEDGSSRSMA